MEFDNKFEFEWGDGENAEPSVELRQKGFTAGYKPPAGVFNWFWSKVIKIVTELQSKFGAHADNKENPHGVTATQVGLDKVNNTPDSEKSVKFASEAGVGRKVKYPLHLRFNGGKTENVDYFVYDGEVSASINITPEKIGAAEEEHSHSYADIEGRENIKTEYLADAISTDGIEYTATIEGITELYNGLTVTIIPNMTSTKAAVNFNLNGLGAKNIRAKINGYNSGNSGTLAAFASWIGENVPLTIQYISKFDNWQTVDFSRPSASGLYGSVDVEQGGTGAATAENARKNLEVAQAVEDATYEGCYYRMAEGLLGEEKEWINPPMMDGVEYRTTERYHGNAVYTYQVSLDDNAINSLNSDNSCTFTDEHLQVTTMLSSSGMLMDYGSGTGHTEGLVKPLGYGDIMCSVNNVSGVVKITLNDTTEPLFTVTNGFVTFKYIH